MKIGTKLVGTFLLVALLPLAASGLFIYLHVQSSLTEQVFNHLGSVASFQKHRLESLLGQNLERLSLIASRTQLRLSLDAYSRNGDLTHLRKMHKILGDAKQSIEDIEAIFILGLDGRVVASTTADWIGRDDSRQAYFNSGRNHNKGDILVLDQAGRVRLFLSGPLMLNDRPLGVVVVDLRPDTLLSLTSDYSGLGSSGETLLARNFATGEARYLMPLRFDPAAALRRQVLNDTGRSPISQALEGREGTFKDVNDYRGIRTLAVSRYIPLSGWALVVKIDRTEALAPIADTQRLMLAGLIILACAIVLASMSMARVIGRPVEKIAQLADRIGEGDQTIELGLQLARAPREILSLGQSIDRMSRSLLEQQRARAQDQETLKRNEWFLDAIVENIPDMIFVKDAGDLRFVRFNKAGEELLGYPREALLTKNDYDFFPKEEADFFVAKDREVLDSGKLLDIPQEPIETRRHGKRTLHTKKIPIHDESGEPIYLLGISEDITERRKVEQSLRRFRELLDLALDAIAVIDPTSGCYLDVNQSLCDFLGVNRATMLQRHPYDFSELIDSPQRWRETVEQLRLHGQMTVEDRGHCEDGSPFIVEVKAHYARDQGEEYIVAIFRDIKERKQTEKALQESEQRFRTAGKAAYDLIYEWDVATDSLEWFGDVDGMLGYPEGEISRDINAWLGLIHPEDIQTLVDAVELHRTSTEAIRYEYRIRQHSGEYRHWSDHGLPLLDDRGQPYRWIGVCKDISAQKEHQRQLEYIAHYDTLTDLPNRVLLIDRLQQAMAQEQRRGQQLAVVYVDLDGFKAINDAHGHDVGDRLLAALANRLKQALREGDTIARLGGDEFVAVLLDIGGTVDYVPLLKRLLEASARPVHMDERVLQVSASLGVTFYPQAEETDADRLLRQSDLAMYQAKLAGKNRYHVFDTEQDRNLRGRHESLERIREAMVDREFLLHYQPKVNMRTGEVVGAEALIRWQHPEQGLLSPIYFLPIIEEQPLAVELGEWVIDTALTQMETWLAQGLDLPVSVNIGARQLQHQDFVERLGELLAAHPDIGPDHLELEVLETSALEDMFQVSEIMRSCKRIGVSFALDDFGTGYSSLTYLKHLPAASLKIDRAFVRDMLDDPDDLAILEGILGMSAAFRRQVIAEGVETREHGELLLRLGCELAQGYGIARPMPAAQMPQWIAGWQPHPSWETQHRISRDDLSLLFASMEHRAWIRALEEHIRDQHNEPPPLDHTECRFGQWLKGQGEKRYGAEAVFPPLVSLHQQIHRIGERLCALQARGQQEQAVAALEELHGTRDALLLQLQKLLAGH